MKKQDSPSFAGGSQNVKKFDNTEKLTPTQQKLFDFLSPIEIPGIHRRLKQVFRAANFDSDISENVDGKDALFTLYMFIELIDGLKTEIGEEFATPITPAQQELLDFLKMEGTPVIYRQLKEVFRAAIFESGLIENADDGKNALFPLYMLIELIEGMKTDIGEKATHV